MENIVCICTQALFNHLNDDFTNVVYTKYEHCIRKEDNSKDVYYDLYKNDVSCLRLCCDGEQCIILEKTNDYVTLMDVENIDNPDLFGIDTKFKLSMEEFIIATA